VNKNIIVEGTTLSMPRVGVGPKRHAKVSIKLTPKGGLKCLAFTKRCVGKPMAVVFFIEI